MMGRRLMTCIAAGLASVPLGGCGAAGGEQAALAGATAREPSPSIAASRPTQNAPAGTCAFPKRLGPGARTVGLGQARESVDRAAGHATATGHRFRSEVTITAGDSVTVTATVVGRRLSGGQSEARVTWSGGAGLILPRTTARIVDNVLFVRVRNAPWTRAGSASGISLDVGRELLDHPFLLNAARARSEAGRLTLLLVAPDAPLRIYASTERDGVVTELLRGARGLRVTPTVSSGVLVGERYELTTNLPTALATGFSTRFVRVAAQTGYCPLRAADRADIAAPRVPDS